MYPLDILPPYVHGSCYILSRDITEYIELNKEVLAASMVFGCDPANSNVEDFHISLWLFALGILPLHDHRLSDHLHCHCESIALFDMPADLMFEAYSSDLLGKCLCTERIRYNILKEYDKRIRDGINVLSSYNNAAWHYALLGNYSKAAEYMSFVADQDSLRAPSLFYLRGLEANGCDSSCRKYLEEAIEQGIMNIAKAIAVPVYAESQSSYAEIFPHIKSTF